MSHAPRGDAQVAEPEAAMTDASNDRVVEADVVVVGAGPGGSAAATHLARRGLTVALVEKSVFPREKVCGDGLTPRATRQLIRLGIDTSEAAGWKHVKGLRVYGSGQRPFELPWPELRDFPDYGLVLPRSDFDNLLARNAVAAGADLYQDSNVAEPILDDRTDRIVGVRTRDGREFRAPMVVAADGNSSRLAVRMGLDKNDKRPMGVAVRTYYTSPRHDEEYLESFLELWDGKPGASNLLPGYGWMFPVGDGTANVGLGILNSSSAFGKSDYRQMMRAWLANTPEEWGFREENMTGPIRGAALPMGFNRKPHYTRGLVLVGDSGGMVSPFNGEGIAYAIEAGEYAASAISDAHYRGVGTRQAELALQAYPTELRAAFGGYYRLGHIFVKLIGNPTIMKLCTEYGLPRKTLMKFVMKLLANLTDAHEGDAMDRIINTLARMAPSA